MFARICLLALAMMCVPALAQDFRFSKGSGGSGGGGTNGRNEYQYRSSGTPAKPFPIDDQLRKRLVVEWGKAAMGYVDYDPEDDDGPIWKDDDSLRPDRYLSIRGRLLVRSEDGKSVRPIDWLQPIRVVVSRLPETKHDWSERQEMHDAVWDEFITGEKGEFLVRLSPGEVRRAIGKPAKFQVGLSLGTQEGAQVRWENTIGVLPQSVTMLTIPGVPAISPTMQIINGAPSYQQNDFNPAKLVRAVNHLLPLGKEKAIAALRDFLKVARDDYQSLRMDENIDTSDKTCVFLIVRLLFEPMDLAEELPAIMTVPFAPIPTDADRKFWPLHPVHLQDDVPFFLVLYGGLGGVPDQPERHVNWAEEHGKIRAKPLRPLDNPMMAASRLIALPQTKRLFDEEFFNTDFAGLLYRQAWNIIEDADPESPKPKPVLPANDSEEDDDWEMRIQAASKRKIRWDEMESRYVVE